MTNSSDRMAAIQRNLDAKNIATREMREAVQEMLKTVRKVSTAEEFQSLNKNNASLEASVQTLAETFTILANRIQELDPGLQKKLQAKQEPAPRNTPIEYPRKRS